MEHAKPNGTVTFLFTDIEGSTKLARQHPDSWESMRKRHHVILRTAIEAEGGYIFQVIGDAFCATFHTARQAYQAAVQAQTGLQSDAEIKVRMGLHTGTAELQEDGQYQGYLAMSRVQRLMSAGHGGQVLVSQATEELIREGITMNSPNGVSLRDLGEKRLKDQPRPEHIYQLVIPGLPSDFPALRIEVINAHNLPPNLTKFIGRERELGEIQVKIAENRLLTLTGPGGTGKTRLSIQVGRSMLEAYPDGVWMVELAPVSDPGLIVQTIASVFGLREGDDRPMIELVTDYLRAKKLLLILDNCEHLVEACARLAERLLRDCPTLTILASSREALGVTGEATYRVPSLALPEIRLISSASLRQSESGALFLDRALTANPNFNLTDANAEAIAQVCRRLDGIPLALELAAARVRVMSVEQIADRLDNRFRLLTGGSRTAMPRQQTLKALIDWSYDLLSEPEKALFRRLAVFEGGWTLEAAESVCADDTVETWEILDLLTQLVDKSLVFVVEKDGVMRYHRLETIRQYSRDKLLETDEAIPTREKHLAYFSALARFTEEQWQGPGEEQVEEKLFAEYDNLRSALTWAVDNEIEAITWLLSWAVLYITWMKPGHISEGRDWCQTILRRIESLHTAGEITPEDYSKLKALTLDRLAVALMNLGDHQASRAAAAEGAALARVANEQRTLAAALASQGIGALYSGDPEQALKVTEESMAISTQMGYQLELWWAINTMVHISTVTGDRAQQMKYMAKRNTMQQDLGLPPNHYLEAMEQITQAYLDEDADRIFSQTENALAILAEKGNKYDQTFLQTDAAHYLRRLGKYDTARTYYRQIIRVWQDLGHRAAVAHLLECFAMLSEMDGHAEQAVKLLGAAVGLREASHSVRTPEEQGEFEAVQSALRGQLAEADFAAAWEAGQALTMGRAVELALGESS